MKGQLGIFLLPEALDTDAFRAVWADWLADRKERRLGGYTARAQQAQLLRLAEMGHDAAVEAIRWSIAQGYNGIWPPPAQKDDGRMRRDEKQPSIWAMKAQLDAVEQRLREYEDRSPGSHVSVWELLDDKEKEDYRNLRNSRILLRRSLSEGDKINPKGKQFHE